MTPTQISLINRAIGSLAGREYLGDDAKTDEIFAAGKAFDALLSEHAALKASVPEMGISDTVKAQELTRKAMAAIGSLRAGIMLGRPHYTESQAQNVYAILCDIEKELGCIDSIAKRRAFLNSVAYPPPKPLDEGKIADIVLEILRAKSPPNEETGEDWIDTADEIAAALKGAV